VARNAGQLSARDLGGEVADLEMLVFANDLRQEDDDGEGFSAMPAVGTLVAMSDGVGAFTKSLE
jgi:hypothetical protein